jgi:fructokinase
MRRFDLGRLVVTRGSQGWTCVDAYQCGWLEGRSPSVDVRDTVGAGDAFSSVLLLGEVNQWPLETSLKRAADFASAVCTLRGAVDYDAHLYESTLAKWNAVRAGHAAS